MLITTYKAKILCMVWKCDSEKKQIERKTEKMKERKVKLMTYIVSQTFMHQAWFKWKSIDVPKWNGKII